MLRRDRFAPRTLQLIGMIPFALFVAVAGCGGDAGNAQGQGGSATTAGSAGAATSAGTGGHSPTTADGSAGTNAGGGLGRAGAGSGNAGAATGGSGGAGAGGAVTGGSSGNTSGGGMSGGASGGSAGGSAPVTCPSPAAKAGNTTRTVQVGGVSRSYVLHVPAKYDGTKPAPLIVDYHGLGGTASGEAGSSPYPAQTDADGVVMAFPGGVSGSWNLGTCCVDADDVGFSRALVADAAKVACIDPKRVYAVGFSLGGGFTHTLGCQAADVFAAIAPAAADLVKETVDACKPARPITVITFRGSADGSVKYAGGPISGDASMPLTGLGAKASFDKWAQIDQCTGTASAEDKNGCASYTTCAAGAEVILCTKQGGGHEPGNAAVGWPVLKRHTLP